MIKKFKDFFNCSNHAAYGCINNVGIEKINHRGFSESEIEVYNFVKTIFPMLEIIKNKRGVLKRNMELDLFIPSKNLAVEFNGNYWYCSINGKNQHYQLNKTIECEDKSIKLIHIFEDEWLFDTDKIKKLIVNNIQYNYVDNPFDYSGAKVILDRLFYSKTDREILITRYNFDKISILEPKKFYLCEKKIKKDWNKRRICTWYHFGLWVFYAI